MTEPKKPDPHNLEGIDLPILTEVDDGQVDIPDFDFSSELDQMSSALSTPEMPLEFPPELLEALPDTPSGDGPINLQDLPSLELGDETPAASPQGADHEFEFELEPLNTPTQSAGGLDALLSRTQFDEPDQTPVMQPADDSGAQIPELTLDDVLPEPSSNDHLSPESAPADIDDMTGVMFEQGPVEVEETDIPELTLDDVLGSDAAAPAESTAKDADAIPELALEDALGPVMNVAPATVIEEPAIPELTLDDVIATDDAAPTESTVTEVDVIPELALDDAPSPVMDAVPALAMDEPVIPELTLDDVLAAPQDAPLATLPEEPAIPELALDDVLAGEPVADMASQDDIPQMAELAMDPPAPTMPDQAAVEMADMSALPVDMTSDQAPETATEIEPELVELPTQADDVPLAMADSVADPVSDQLLADPVAADLAIPTLEIDQDADPLPPTASAEPAESALSSPEVDMPPAPVSDVEPQAVDELVMAAMPMDMAQETEQAEAVQEALADAQDELVQDAAAAASGTDGEATFRSISIDSLPHGVLGGGKGPGAEPQEIEPAAEASLKDQIRAAERTLAQERLRQAMAQAREEAMQGWQPALTEPSVATPPAPSVNPEPGRPVEIINVAGLASSPAPQSFNLPPVRKSYVTLVDEAMLIDSLYDKIMPRMKVELSLWLQDALDHQAKQMLSGVMHQLKEDYEMLFSETLRESLRQAIAEMGREDRGERY